MLLLVLPGLVRSELGLIALVGRALMYSRSSSKSNGSDGCVSCCTALAGACLDSTPKSTTLNISDGSARMIDVRSVETF